MDACAPISLALLYDLAGTPKLAGRIIISCHMQSFMTIHAPGEKFCALQVTRRASSVLPESTSESKLPYGVFGEE